MIDSFKTFKCDNLSALASDILTTVYEMVSTAESSKLNVIVAMV